MRTQSEAFNLDHAFALAFSSTGLGVPRTRPSLSRVGSSSQSLHRWWFSRPRIRSFWSLRHSNRFRFLEKCTTIRADLGDSEKRTQKSSRGLWYARPSAAVERGGGFYVPGLDGPQLRFLLGLLCLLLLATNHLLSEAGSSEDLASSWTPLQTSEVLAALASICVITLAQLEARAPEERAEQRATTSEPSASIVAMRAETGPRSAGAHTRGLRVLAMALANLFEPRVPILALVFHGNTGHVIELHASPALSIALRIQKSDSPNKYHVSDRGEIIDRVLEAGRGIYIPDMTEIPTTACFPFLEPMRPGGALLEPLHRTAGSLAEHLASGTWLLLVVTPVPKVLTSSDYRWLRALCH
ncbi:hypothetical protein CCYA_CCYA14G3849 [Cyanidiococcus yangmingshanensis]|nr:hypothetical protein CCYA_CCYA14G3849 [Cyanidiococcus yangmingshanensis]